MVCKAPTRSVKCKDNKKRCAYIFVDTGCTEYSVLYLPIYASVHTCVYTCAHSCTGTTIFLFSLCLLSCWCRRLLFKYILRSMCLFVHLCCCLYTPSCLPCVRTCSWVYVHRMFQKLLFPLARCK